METPLKSIEKSKQLNVEESRAKRIERQQSRMRDRGGIFKAAEERNTNLFNMLCKAMPRKSPRKSRGRSKSQSVSPTKRLQIARASNKSFPLEGSAKKPRTSPRKRAQSESPTKSKGKQKQEAIKEVEDVDNAIEAPKAKPKGNKTTSRSKGKQKEPETIPEDDDVEEVTKPPKAKAKPRGRKAAAPKKPAAKAPRRTKKAKEGTEVSKSLDDDPTHKPKGKRKIADSQDDEQPMENPPPKPKRARTAKAKAAVQDDLEDTITTKKAAPQKKAAPKKRTAASESRANVSPNADDKDEDVVQADPAPTMKPSGIPEPEAVPESPKVSKEHTKAKLIQDNEDQCQPKEVPTKVQPKKKTASSKSQSKSKPEKTTAVNDIANAINESFRKRTLEEEISPEAIRVAKKDKNCEPLVDNKQTRSKATSKAKGSKLQEEESNSNESVEVEVASKPKKRTKVQMSDDGDSDSQPILKKAKIDSVKATEPIRTALKTKTLSTETNTILGVEKSKDDTVNKPPTTKTTSRKRKENTNTTKPESKTKTSTSQVKKSVKKGVLSGVPPNVKQRLIRSHNHDDYDSDDPIDFLS